MIGFTAIAIFMIAYYMFFGVVSVLALAINLMLLVALLSMLQATLTLPGIAAIALTLGMAIDAKTRKPRISNVTAGLSGPAIKPVALRMVYEAAHTVEIPVIGMGGITTAEDAVEFMLAGAAAVEVGTANFWDPCATEKIVDGLQRWCFENRVKRITDLIGTLET